MKKWTVLERTTTPDKSALTLSEHDGEYVLRVNGRELMSNKRHASELRLGELGGIACANKPRARILIGGLGLGYTLRGALATARQDAEVIVAELLPEVLAWNRNPAYPLSADLLADARTQVVVGDVFACIRDGARGAVPAFDAILLDADNGTTAMMSAGNKALYHADGVALARNALAPRGVAVYWSATPEPQLERTMRRLGFSVTVEVVRAYGSGGVRYYLVIGKRGQDRSLRTP